MEQAKHEIVVDDSVDGTRKWIRTFSEGGENVRLGEVFSTTIGATSGSGQHLVAGRKNCVRLPEVVLITQILAELRVSGKITKPNEC